MTVTQAADYLGVSLRKMAQILKDGVVKFTIDPLDRRRRLVSVQDLNELKQQSLAKD